MKIYLFLLMLGLFALGKTVAQSKVESTSAAPSSQLAGLGVYVPVGSFSESHRVGLGIDYARSKYRFGADVKTKKLVGWVLGGGLHYYLGKKTSFNGYDFRYGGYLNTYAAGGIIINAVPRANIILTSGPSLDLYKSGLNGGARANLSMHYFVSPQTAIGASFNYLKHFRSESFLSLGLKAAYAF